MIRSPSSASATSSARSRCGGIDQGLDQSLGAAVDQGRAAGELGELAQEGAGLVIDHRPIHAQRIPVGHLELALEDDEDPRRDFPGAEEKITLGKSAERAEAPQPVDFHRGQGGKRLIAPSFENVGDHGTILSKSGAGGRVISTPGGWPIAATQRRAGV